MKLRYSPEEGHHHRKYWGSIIFTNRLVSTTAHGYHCAPTPTPTTFKETARSETSLAEPPTGGGGVVGSVANPPFGGGVAPFRGSALYRNLMQQTWSTHLPEVKGMFL